MATDWLLCSYRLPREPSRLRLAVWRRLKRVGAVMVHDGLWVLPTDAKTREDFEWLAEEIEERGGSVMLWEAHSLPQGQDSTVVLKFRAEAEARYATIAQAAKKLARRRSTAASLEKAMQQLRGLERTLRLERRRDYFRAAGRQEAEETVEAAAREIRLRARPKTPARRLHAVGN